MLDTPSLSSRALRRGGRFILGLLVASLLTGCLGSVDVEEYYYECDDDDDCLGSRVCLSYPGERRKCVDLEDEAPCGVAATFCECGADEACPDGACVNLETNANHCGGCGVRCDEGITCVSGVCSDPPQTLSGDGPACGWLNDLERSRHCEEGEDCCFFAVENRCVSLDTDPANCGACGAECGAGASCEGGECRCGDGACPIAAGRDNVCCDDGAVCVDLLSGRRDPDDATEQPLSCGACGNSCLGGDPLRDTVAGVCLAQTCGCSGPQGQFIECGPTAAGRARVCCESGCIDLTVDPANCGACGRACGQGETCDDGQCRCAEGGACAQGEACCDRACRPADDPACLCGVTACGDGQLCCEHNGEGLCVDPRRSDAHCGACQRSCGEGFGCQENFSYDPSLISTTDLNAYVGVCRRACPADLIACPFAGDGDCIDPSTDPDFCGASLALSSQMESTGLCNSRDLGVNFRGSRCDAGESCQGGRCRLRCALGLAICKVEERERCVDPQSDARYCGAMPPDASRVGETGMCDNTKPESADYQGINCLTLSDTDEALCVEGRCVIVSCSPGRDDCDQDPLNGCECAL